MPDVKLLDCTLRDGGYINDWQWGASPAKHIIRALTNAGVDIVEVGFLRNVPGYDPDVTVCNTIEELNRLLPPPGSRGSTMYSGMAMRSNYDIRKLTPYDGTGIEILRITAHDYDIREGMDFAREVKARGYKLAINPINIMGYTDSEILWILDEVNKIHPWQFSIVDTFGSMRRKDLQRITALADHNLDPAIRLGLHLHENMALSFCLAQEFLEMPLQRDKTVDASLIGMGRIPGNLPIELTADYMNENCARHFDLDQIMDAIQDYLAPIQGESPWGYTPAYFLSARFNLHRNYAEHYLGKGDLTNRDINHILAAIAPEKKTAFDKAYADTLYQEYKNRRVQDDEAPDADVTVSVNFVPGERAVDYAFFSNAKRFEEDKTYPCRLILTSNLRSAKQGAVLNYDRLSTADDQGGNSMLMLLRLLRLCDAAKVKLAGADGYRPGTAAYADAGLHTHTGRGEGYNRQIAGAMRTVGLPVEFLTPSEYEGAMP